MSSGSWQCPDCGERQEPEFSECWKCGYLKGSGGDEALEPDPASDPMVCPNCKLTLDFVGTKKFHEGSRAAPFLLGEVGELFVKREHFDVYVCSRCGRIELFLDGVGEEFRPHQKACIENVEGLVDSAVAAIEEVVHRETRAWNTRDLDLLLSVFHPDMVWPWPPHKDAHDPVEWVIPWGRYNEERWRTGWGELFETHELVHNRRVIQRIEVAPEGDGGFAVVDVDTLWRDREGLDFHWFGRSCKIYTLVESEWKLIAHTGLLEYPGMSSP